MNNGKTMLCLALALGAYYLAAYLFRRDNRGQG